MKKSLSFFLTLALLCALNPNPARGQTYQSLERDTVVKSGETLTIGASWRTGGHSITVRQGGTLTIAEGVTLLIDTAAADFVKLDTDAIAINYGTVKADSVTSRDSIGRHGIIIDSAQITNNGVIDFGEGGKITVSGGASTIASPGLIVFKKDSAPGGHGTLSFQTAAIPVLTGFTKTLYKADGKAKKNQIDVHGYPTTGGNVWTDLQQGKFASGDTLVVKDSAKLVVPATATLRVDTGAKLTIQPSGSLTVNGIWNNLGTVNIEGAYTNWTGDTANLTLAGGSRLTNNDSILVSGKATIQANAVVHNYGRVELTSTACFTNASDSLSSPGLMISPNYNANVEPGTPKQGFFVHAYYWSLYGDCDWTLLQQAELDRRAKANQDSKINIKNATLRVTGDSLHVGDKHSYIEVDSAGTLKVESGGLVVINGDAYTHNTEGTQHTAILGKGRLVIEEGGTVRITGNDDSTLINYGTIENTGLIAVTDGGTFQNENDAITGTGLIVVSGAGAALKMDTARQAVVVNTKTTGDSARTIFVYGENNWTPALQAYLDSAKADTIKLDSAIHRLAITPERSLKVPANKRLTIKGGTNPGRIFGRAAASPQTLRLAGANGDSEEPIGVIDASKGIAVLDSIPIDSIYASVGKEGFFATAAGTSADTTITVYGDVESTSQLQTALGGSKAKTLRIAEDASLTVHSLLTIPDSVTLLNEGTLTGPATGATLVVHGTLYNAAGSDITNLLDVRIADDGTETTALNPEWISFPDTGYVSQTTTGQDSLVVIKRQIDGKDTVLIPGGDYSVAQTTNKTLRIIGKGAYCDTLYIPYRAVEKVELNKDTLRLAKNEEGELTAEVKPDAPDSVNTHVKWEVIGGSENVELSSDTGKTVTVTASAADAYKIVVTTVEGGHRDTAVVIVSIPVDSVTIEGAKDQLAINDTLTLTAKIAPEDADAAYKAVDWKIETFNAVEELERTDSTITVTGKAEGQARIIVTTTDGKHSDTVVVSVVTEVPQPVVPKITEVEITGAEDGDSLAVGSSLALTEDVAVEPKDSTVSYDVAWATSDTLIATVDSGLVTGIAEGEAYIKLTVTTTDSAYTDSVKIKVVKEVIAPEPVAPKITEVKITGAADGDSLAVGSSLALTEDVAVEPKDSTVSYDVAWATSDTLIATVDSGLVTGIAEGEAYIKLTVTTTDNAYTDSVKIKVVKEVIAPEEPVVPEITEVAITGAEDGDSLAIGSSLELTADIAVEPKDSTVSYDVAWATSDTLIATVDSLTGVVTGVSEGVATITLAVIADGNLFTDNVTIVVYTEPEDTIPTDTVPEPVVPKITAVEITGAEDGATLTIVMHEDGETDYGTLLLEAVVTTEGEGEVDYVVAWSSSDEDVAAVDENGGVVTAVAAGEATITLTVKETATGKEFTDELTITVTEEVIVPPPAITGVWIEVGEGNLDITTYEYDNTTEYGALQLTARVTIEPAGEVDYSVAWSSSNPAVAAVDEATGLVTAVSAGAATITLTVTPAEGEAILRTLGVTVREVTVPAVPVTGVTIAGADSIGLQKGDTLQLHWSIDPVNANNKAVTWKSINQTIAEVSDSGRVIAKADGTTRLVVTTVDSARTDTIKVTVYTVHVESVIIAGADSIGLQKDSTLQLEWTVLPANANNKKVTWKSANAAIASVSEDGRVTAKADGETQLVVTTRDDSVRTDTIKVTVFTIPITGVRIADKADIEDLQVGKTLQLTAHVLPANANGNRGASWRSYNPEIATVDKDGKVTGVSVGDSAMIVATAIGTTFRDTAYIKVFTIDVERITIDGTGEASIAIRDTLRLTATVEPLNATNLSYTWKSDNTAVAVVDKDGKVTGVSAGAANIVATSAESDDYTDTLRLTVYKVPVESVTIDNMPDSLAVGSSVELVASVEPSAPTDTVVTWRSGDEAIAKVDAAGKVTGVSAGETYIIAASDGKQDSLTIKVYTVPVSGVSIAAAADSVATGYTLGLTATIEPANASNKAVIWESSDEAVATVEDGVVTGVADGEATIYVTTEDGEYRDSIAIAVYTIPVPVTGVTIADATDSLATGKTLQLSAVIEPEGANVDYETAWATSDTLIATVSEDGLVTAVSEGEATITLTVTTEDNAYTAEVTIAVYTEEPEVVVPKITAVAIKGSTSDTLHIHTHEDTTIPDRGNTRQLTADVTIEPEGEVAYTVAWSSSDETVATVSETGLVTAVAEGPVTITLTVTETATGKVFTETLDISIQTVGIAPVPATSVKAYIADNTLYVNSAVAEKIDIYTISGKLAYSAVKPAGEVQINLTGLSDGVLLIRGASGWVRKVVK